MAIETVPANDGIGGVFIVFGNTRVGQDKHHLPAMPEGAEGLEPTNWTHSAYKVLDEVMEQMVSVMDDPRFSESYKADQLRPLHVKAVESAAKLSSALDTFEAQVDSEEASYFKTPDVHPTASVVGLRLWEIRDWYRNLPHEERHAVRDAIAKGEAGEEIEIALVSSPVKLLDADLLIVSEAWKSRKRSQHMDAFARLEVSRASIDRSRRAAGFIAATTSRITKWDRDRVIDHLIASNDDFVQRGGKAFGVSAKEVAHRKLLAEARKRAERFGLR